MHCLSTFATPALVAVGLLAGTGLAADECKCVSATVLFDRDESHELTGILDADGALLAIDQVLELVELDIGWAPYPLHPTGGCLLPLSCQLQQNCLRLSHSRLVQINLPLGRPSKYSHRMG